MGGAARDLARNVAIAVAREPVTLTVRNLSSLGPADVAEIQRAFESELRTSAPAAADVRVTVSDNLSEFVLAAEIGRHGERQVLLESWPRGSAAAPANSGPRIVLDRKLLWEQDQPILDAAQAGASTAVLDQARVLLIEGSAQRSAPIPAVRPWPRDLRGRLSFSGPALTAWLPGMVCRGSVEPQLSINCQDSPDPWLLAPGLFAAFAPARNYFDGHVYVSPGGARQVPPFYSAAVVGGEWMASGGQWGDVAAVETACGVRVLATHNSSRAEPDSIQPFEVTGGTPRAAGPALEFSGPVTALWSNGSTATAIARDLETGRYAAFSLAPACRN